MYLKNEIILRHNDKLVGVVRPCQSLQLMSGPSVQHLIHSLGHLTLQISDRIHRTRKLILKLREVIFLLHFTHRRQVHTLLGLLETLRVAYLQRPHVKLCSIGNTDHAPVDRRERNLSGPAQERVHFYPADLDTCLPAPDDYLHVGNVRQG